MKNAIRNILAAILDPVVTRLGYVSTKNKTASAGKNSLLHTLFTNLKAIGFIPAHVIDIGANHGTWTREALKYFPDSRFTLLEPQEYMQASFQDLLDTHPSMAY